MPLSVSGAFHSRLMDDAAVLFARSLASASLKNLSMPLIANSTAQAVQHVDEVRAALVAQMNNVVRWRETQDNLATCDLVIQVGPGNVYTRMLQREHPDCRVISFNEPADWQILEEVLV